MGAGPRFGRLFGPGFLEHRPVCPVGGSSAAAHAETLRKKKRNEARLLRVLVLTGSDCRSN